MRSISVWASVLVFLASTTAFGQGNGNLQIHHIDVGQGDGAVLISPGGEVALFDGGEDMRKKDCTRPLSYLDQLGIKQIDHLFVSHYHFDHIGCIPAILEQFPLAARGVAHDRGGSYHAAAFDAYLSAVGKHRKTAKVGETIALDEKSKTPVRIAIIAVNGDSSKGHVDTTNENDLSLAAVVSFGRFREEIGGDLSGDDTKMYQDVESPVARGVGQIDVYKVHHHCSSHSTNDAWLKATKPTVGIISVGDGNDYGHPAADCLERLHQHNVKRIFWTEQGNGEHPEAGLDVVAGNILVEVAAAASTYSVTYGGSQTETFHIGGGAQPAPTLVAEADGLKKYAWSVRSGVYHQTDCPFVANISPANLQRGSAAPTDKRPHAACLAGH